MDRFDRYWIGILVGLLLPAIFGLTYIEVMNLWYPLKTLQFQAGGVLSKLLLVRHCCSSSIRRIHGGWPKEYW